jgi:glucosamine 6-phosphate synthetase-like amidotransferase/phosphosugar isomerase protein
VVPVYLLAYYYALSKGVDVERPRNLVRVVVLID